MADANRKLAKGSSVDEADEAYKEAIVVNEAVPEAALGLAASSLTSAGAATNQQQFTRPLGPKGLWRVEYNFTSLYEVSDINPATMESINSRLKANQTWFDAYFRTNMVSFEGPWECNSMCRIVHTCAISNVDYNDYSFCVNQALGDQGLVGGAGSDGINSATWPLGSRPSFIVTSFTAIISSLAFLLLLKVK